jgi:excisionase family DNA binding protein
MGLIGDLERICAGMPEEAAVSLPVVWLRARLEEEAREGGGPDRLLTLEEVAEVVGRAVSTVRSWCNSGRIEGAFRLNGRDWRVPESALRKYLESQQRDEVTGERNGVGGSVDLGSWRKIRTGGAG